MADDEKVKRQVLDGHNYVLRFTVTLEHASDPTAPKHRRAGMLTFPEEQIYNSSFWRPGVAAQAESLVSSMVVAESTRLMPPQVEKTEQES